MTSENNTSEVADDHKNVMSSSKHSTEKKSFFSEWRNLWRSWFEYDMEPLSPGLLDRNTAMGRVKEIFYVHRTMVGTDLSPELQGICQTTMAGMITGAIFGGRYGMKVHTAKFISDNKLTQYDHVVQAERHMHSNALFGCFKFAFRWGWRLGLLAGMYTTSVQVIAAARNKEDGINYIGAGTTTGFLYKMFLGWREMVVGVVIFTGLSIPVGAIMHGLHSVTPESIHAKRKQDRIKRRLMMQEDWQERLGQAESTIGKIDGDFLFLDSETDEESDDLVSEQKSETPAESEQTNESNKDLVEEKES